MTRRVRRTTPETTSVPASTQPEEMRSAALARATIRGLVLRQLLANLAGLVTVMLFLWLVLPTQDSGAQRDTELNLIVFAAYVGGTVIIGLPLNWLLLQGLIRWIQGKRPGAILRALTLRIPTFEATFAMLGWIGAAIIFASVNRSPRIGVGIAIAGLLTCAAIFLILERHLRPVFELTLDGRVHGRRSNNLLPRLMLFWALGSGLPVLIIGLIPLVAPSSTITSWRSSLLIAVALAGGGAIMRIAALSITRPVEAVRKAMASVTDGNLAVHVPVDDLGETGRLARSKANGPVAKWWCPFCSSTSTDSRPSRSATPPPRWFPCSMSSSRWSTTPPRPTAAGSTSSKVTPP